MNTKEEGEEMNMFEYEVFQKRRSVSSSRHKKNGSKSKKCTLPSDRLTEKQIKERHGATIVYNLTKPMTWEEFKKLPAHAQEEYIIWLNLNFGATASDIARMFGVASRTVANYASTKNINVNFSRGHRMDKSKKADWENFIHPEDTMEQVEEVPVVIDAMPMAEAEAEPASETVEVSPVPAKKRRTSNINMSEVKLKFDGTIDINALTNTIRAVLGDNIEGQMLIHYQSSSYAE
jgi:hypothetical protein